MQYSFKKLNLIVGWLSFVLASTVYLLTMEPTASFWDCSEFIATSYKLEVGHPPGAPLFMIISRLFAIFAPSPETHSYMINIMSALCSGFTILFLFLTITHLAKKVVVKEGEECSMGQLCGIMGAGLVGALTYTFTDTFWFSAVEGEVYAMSSLFTAVVFWAILKWENVAFQPYANRWLIFIAYMVGLSIGVHLLNLLVIPAIVFIYYFKKYETTKWGIIKSAALSIVILGVIMWGIIPGVIIVAGWFELLFVNGFGMPFNTGVVIYALLLIAGLTFGIRYTLKHNHTVVNTILTCFVVMLIGYSCYAMVVIRSVSNPPIDENSPDNVFSLLSYISRDQYGQEPLVYGPYFNAPVIGVEDAGPIYYQNEKTGKYDIVDHKKEVKYDPRFCTILPRMYSQAREPQVYYEWVGQPKGPVYMVDGQPVQKPSFGQNLSFMFRYQLGHMYFRYFMWNFSGRQNDIQGNGEVLNGNWITGIPFIDEVLVGPQKDMPFDIINNKGHNVYYMLPLLLGILGLLFQAYSGEKGIQSFWVTFFLFFMTGLAIVLYLNQTPYQPRERDYAYAGSFYAFCIWIGFGVAALAKGLERYGKLNPVIAGSVATVLCLFIPIQMAGQNWDDHDRSGRYVCRDFGSNYLESCEPNAIIFTNGDNDTFPLWYAQEVEGVRTDVRVCNTSYLQTDWYIDQMKKQAYESAPLPITWTRDQYIQGTRDAAYVFPLTKDSIDLNTALNFVRSDDPKFKKIPGINQELDYIPADKLYYKVDSIAGAKILGGKTDGMVDQMMINLAGKNALGKQELTILDMLQTNNFERPMYYAITVSPDQFVNLDGYFEQTGLAYQVVPKNANKAVNTDKMYDNVMNKFKWGGVDKPGVYIDENVMRMCKSYRMMLFNKLAEALVKEGKNDKALEVLDKCMQVLPPENVPLDYTALSTGELYYVLGQKEKAAEIFTGIADNMMRNINWYFRLNPVQLASVETELLQDMQVLNQVLLINKHYNPEFNKKYQEEFDNYRMAYESVRRE